MRLVAAQNDGATAPDVALSPSVIRILGGALDAIAARGIRRVSMSDIIDASGVSRGTLYRYFSNKDDVLAAVSEYVCVGFEDGIRDAANSESDPFERFRAVMQFYGRYTAENSPGRVFEVEPVFHIAFFRSRFDRYIKAMLAGLSQSFDHLETLTGEPINREAFVETLVRIQLSTLLVPASDQWKKLWDDSADNIQKWALKMAATQV